jgi:hypothetical protein
MGRMRFRKLRIALSALCGIFCLLVIVYWVRSYRVNEVIAFPAAGTKFYVQSLVGRVVFARALGSVSFRQPVTEGLRKNAHKRENRLGFEYYQAPSGDPRNDLLAITIPNWFLVAVFAVLGVIPWATRFKRQFGLRSLLIVTTLIAIALGVIASLQ